MTDTLTHELIHAFDYCRADIDFNNLDHIACTEVDMHMCTLLLIVIIILGRSERLILAENVSFGRKLLQD